MQQTTEEMWAERVRTWRARGLTAREFSRRSGFAESTLSAWVRKLAATSRPVGSVSLVRVGEPKVGAPKGGAPVLAASDVELVVRGITIRVRRGFDAEALRVVLDVVAGARG